MKLRALSESTVHIQKSTVTFDNAQHRCQAEARSFSFFLGGIEWIENFCARLFRDASTRIGDGQTNKISCGPSRGRSSLARIDRHTASRNLEQAARRHGIACIDTEIEQNLMNLSRISH